MKESRQDNNAELLSLREIADYLQLSYSTVRGWKAEGKLGPPDEESRPDRWKKSRVEKMRKGKEKGNGNHS